MKTRPELYAALREAAKQGDTGAVVTLTEQLEQLDSTTKEMGTFDPKRKVAKKTYEAEDHAEAEDDAEDEDVEEADGPGFGTRWGGRRSQRRG